MQCKKCGASLPSHGFICRSCGTMMSSEQIKEQKGYMRDNNQKVELNFLSDKYRREPIVRDYSNDKPKENKYLGALLIILVIIVLIIIAILKVI